MNKSKTGYFIYIKKTGRLYNGIPYADKTDALKELKVKKSVHYYGIYLKLLKKNGWIGDVIYNKPTNSEYYYFKRDMFNLFAFEHFGKGDFHYTFNYTRFNKKIWKPYMEKHFEIRKCKYHIEIE